MPYVDYDAKIEKAEQQLKDLKEKRALQENKIYVPIGQAVAKLLPDVLTLKTKMELDAYLKRALRVEQQSQQASAEQTTQEY